MGVTGDTQWHCCNCLRPSGCSSSRSSSFDLFYLTTFQGLAFFQQKEQPAGAQHLSVCWGGLSNDQYPDLAGTWVLASSAATVLGTDILNHHIKMCQSLVWLRYSLCPGTQVLLHREVQRERRNSIQPKEWRHLFRTAFRCDYIFKAI